MKRIFIILSLLTSHFSPLTSSAAVPLRWTVETSRLQPAVFDVVRGETLALEASFQSYGKPFATSNMTAFLCWQTNGMANAWWVTNAVTAATVARVLFTPEMDPGVPVINAFLGLSDSTNQPNNLTTQQPNNPTTQQPNNPTTQQPSISYRAAFTLRFRHGPGAAPNVIDQPPRILDLAHTVVVNPPWPTQADFAATTTVMRADMKAYIDSQITGAGLVSPEMTTNIAGKVVSNVVTKAYVEDLGIEAGLTENQVKEIVKSSTHTNGGAVAYAEATFVKKAANEIQQIDSSLNFSGEIYMPTWGSYHAVNGSLPVNLPSYLASTAWAGSNKTLSDYGIADAYTKTQADATFRTRTDNVCHDTTVRWFGTNMSYEVVEFFWTPLPNQYGHECWVNNGVFLFKEDHAGDMNYLIPKDWVEKAVSFINYAGVGSGIGRGYASMVRVATANQPFVTADNVPSTNGLVNAVVATNAAEAVFSSKGPSDIGAYPNTSGQQLAAQVSMQGAHLNAEDAQFVSTNYDSAVHMPEAYVRIRLQQGGTNVWRTIWEEMRRWNAFCGSGFNWQTWGGLHTWSTNILAMIEETSPKEYAFYDGTTGEVAPDGFFWISQPRIGICAGAGYQRYLDSGGAVWILESNGLCANIGGTTNGFFRISDEEGNTQFEIIKGDKQTVPATARSLRRESVMGVTHWFCDYAVTNAIAPPVAKFCRNIGANPPVWIADTEASCPCNVTWTPGVNTYTLEFWPKATEPTMFCKAEYDIGGETRIRQAVPTEMQYIIMNGTKYGLVPKTVNGELVMGLTTGN